MTQPSHPERRLQLRGEVAVPVSRDRLEACIGPSPWLVVVPHDDDLVLGCGMLLAVAADLGIRVEVAVCTDGSLGYTDPADQGRIGAVRRKELGDAMAALGLDPAAAHYLSFVDGSLANRLGARPKPEAPGLGQALAALLRRVAPGAVFACHGNDVHPDHRAVAQDTAIACFWASSEIWLELGEPIPLPTHWQYGVYVGFDGPPDLRLVASETDLDTKLRALGCFPSQAVIDALVARVRMDGPEEYFQRAPRPAHGPAAYAAWFDAAVAQDHEA